MPDSTTKDMTIREVFTACNGTYASYSQLSDRVVEVWNEHQLRLPLWPGLNQLFETARDRGWLRSTENEVNVNVSD